MLISDKKAEINSSMPTRFFWFNYRLLLLCFLTASNVVAQGTIVNINQDSTRIMMLLDSIPNLVYIDFDQASQMMSEIDVLLRRQRDPLLLAKSYGVIGAILSNYPTDSIRKISIPYIKKSISYFRTIGDSSGVQKNFNNLSAVHLQLHQYPQMLTYALQSVELAKHCSKTRENSAQLGLSYGNLGHCFAKINWQDSALFNYQRAQFYLEKSNHPALYNVTRHVSLIYIQQKNYEKASLLLHEAYEKCKMKGLKEEAWKSAFKLGRALFFMSDYRGALNYFKLCLSSPALATGSSINIASCYVKMNDIDSASYYLESLKLSEVPLSYQDNYYQSKAAISEAQAHLTTATKYRYKAEVIEDSLKALNDISKTTQILITQIAGKQRGQTSFYQQVLSKRKLLISVLIFTALLALCVVIWFYHKYRSRHIIIRHANAEKEYLHRKLVTQTANLAIQQDLLSHIRVLLDKINKETELHEVHSSIKDTRKQLGEQLNLKGAWAAFFKQFEIIHPTFFKELRGTYKLSEKELKVCAFVKMNLSRKEIAQLINMSPESLNVALSRLKRKLNLKNETSLQDFLLSDKLNKLKETGDKIEDA